VAGDESTKCTPEWSPRRSC